MFPATHFLIGDYRVELTVAERCLIDAQMHTHVFGGRLATVRRASLREYLATPNIHSDAVCTDVQTNPRQYQRTIQESDP